jgi:5-methylcytosine-specific restriction protein A
VTIYFQHVGEAGGHRDFPKTIGTPKAGLRHFKFEDVEPYLSNLSVEQREAISRSLEAEVPAGFQIWGVPSGAKSVLRSLQAGDYVLLLESVGPGGSFAYGGRVVAALPGENFELSMALWGEARFPLIVFLSGRLTNYLWYDFCDALGYKRNWNPAGMTSRIPLDKLTASPWESEEKAIEAIVGAILSRAPSDDEAYFDQIEVNIDAQEGRRVLRQHLLRERSAQLIKAFKASQNDFRCSVCNFSFERAYGELGKGFIEAHHTKEVSAMQPGEKTRLDDLVAVCSNCHRMLHRRYPALTIEELRFVCGEALLKDL